MSKLLYVGIGGFIGSSLRYLLSLYCLKLLGDRFPYGTLAVNALGAVLIGLVMEISLTTKLITPELRLFLTTGILGGFTTFSTFSYETLQLFSAARGFTGLLNTGLNLFLSLGGVALGQYLPRLIVRS